MEKQLTLSTSSEDFFSNVIKTLPLTPKSFQAAFNAYNTPSHLISKNQEENIKKYIKGCSVTGIIPYSIMTFQFDPVSSLYRPHDLSFQAPSFLSKEQLEFINQSILKNYKFQTINLSSDAPSAQEMIYLNDFISKLDKNHYYLNHGEFWFSAYGSGEVRNLDSLLKLHSSSTNALLVPYNYTLSLELGSHLTNTEKDKLSAWYNKLEQEF